MGVTGRISYISTLTRYNSTFAAVAYDPSGNKKMLMTLSARWSMSGYSTDSPSILFYPID